MTEQNKEEQILELDPEQLEEYLSGSPDSDKLPPIEIPFEFYDDSEFYKGIKDASYLSGHITALLNAGLTEGFVLDYLLNQMNVKHNLEVAKINANMNIEMSKHAKATQEKYEL